MNFSYALVMRTPIAQSWRQVGRLARVASSVWPLQHQRWYHELSYSHHGEPMDVLEYHETTAESDLGSSASPDPSSMVQVQMIHVPWNPADVNTVQGKYASPYTSAATGLLAPSCSSWHFPGRSVSGSEGWGHVVAVSETSNIPIGSLVTVAKPGLGTLRSSLWVKEDDILLINAPELLDQIGPSGSTLFQLGGTALRMLTDFVPLQPGEVVIQNAGNSGVGLMVSQLAPATFEAPVVSLVRRGSKSTQEMDELIDYLTVTGKNATILVEEDMDDASYRQEAESKLRDFSVTGNLPRLALNSVGGDSAKSLMRLLDTGGTLVTYGGMSGKPVTVGTPQLIFKDLRAVGYWHSRWMVKNPISTKQQLVDDLVEAVQSKGVECPPCTVFPLKDVQEALNWQSIEQEAIRRKLIFDCR